MNIIKFKEKQKQLAKRFEIAERKGDEKELILLDIEAEDAPWGYHPFAFGTSDDEDED